MVVICPTDERGQHDNTRFDMYDITHEPSDLMMGSLNMAFMYDYYIRSSDDMSCMGLLFMTSGFNDMHVHSVRTPINVAHKH